MMSSNTGIETSSVGTLKHPAPERVLVAAILAALRSTPALRASLGAGIHDDPPAAPRAPYLLVGQTEARPCGGSSTPGGPDAMEVVLTLSLITPLDRADEARSLAATVREVLHDAPLVLDLWRLVSLRVVFVDVCRATDGRTVLGMVRLRSVLEPL